MGSQIYTKCVSVCVCVRARAFANANWLERDRCVDTGQQLFFCTVDLAVAWADVCQSIPGFPADCLKLPMAGRKEQELIGYFVLFHQPAFAGAGHVDT